MFAVVEYAPKVAWVPKLTHCFVRQTSHEFKLAAGVTFLPPLRRPCPDGHMACLREPRLLSGGYSSACYGQASYREPEYSEGSLHLLDFETLYTRVGRAMRFALYSRTLNGARLHTNPVGNGACGS